MNNPQAGDIWHLKTNYDDTYIFLYKELTFKQKFMGNSYALFKGLDLCRNCVVDAHFYDMSIWSKVS